MASSTKYLVEGGATVVTEASEHHATAAPPEEPFPAKWENYAKLLVKKLPAADRAKIEAAL